MASLTERQKRFIVERLACYDTPSEVASAFEEAFGEAIPRQQVNNYDASKAYSRKDMAKGLVAFFDACRAEFKSDTEGISIAQKAVRLRRLDRMSRQAEQMRNLDLAARLMEQAAKECGDAYTNKRLIQMSGAIRWEDLSDEQVARLAGGEDPGRVL